MVDGFNTNLCPAFSQEKKLTGDLVEFAEMYLIDDLCEELLEHVASEAHTEAQVLSSMMCCAWLKDCRLDVLSKMMRSNP